jgi:asparagine synthase (glutamine-hydrolysing)
VCGITGVLEYADGDAVDPGVLRRMTEALRHRGPDDDGVHIQGRVGLGMRRLSIVDVEGGTQPMTDESGDVVVVYNGEIYNAAPLTADLRRAGHRLVTECDTEVLPHLYEDHGPELVDALRGMFAFALWDRRRHRLLLARDRLGIKPLYYRDDGHRLVFGSEIKALLEHPSVTASLDRVALSQYLSLKYVPAPRTMFAGIRALPPGCMLLCDAGGVRLRRWWELDVNQRGPARSEDEYAEGLVARLRESVRLHLRSDVPFGAFLSGGLDSSLVVALMSEVLADPVRTFSVGFAAGGRQVGELPYAALVADRFATKHSSLVMTGEDFVASTPGVVESLDQPIADAPAVPLLLLSQLAARDVKMVLSGEGGDELFAGYARYVGEQAAPFLRPLPTALRAQGLGAAARRARSPRHRIALHALSKADELERMVAWFPLFDDPAKRRLLRPEVATELPGNEAQEGLSAAFERRHPPDPLSRMLYHDTTRWLPDLLLARGDKMSMAASLELRVPLLDHQVVDFAAGLPSRLKVRRLARKVLLRQVARDLLPAPILARPKEGFPMPVAQWLRGEARPLMTDLLAPEAVRRQGLFDPVEVTRLIDAHLSGHRDHARELWGLVVVELWFRRYLGS